MVDPIRVHCERETRKKNGDLHKAAMIKIHNLTNLKYIANVILKT